MYSPSEGELNEEGHTDVGPSEPSTRPCTPPPREEAFEQFKHERGREINMILLQNKGEACIQLYLYTTVAEPIVS